MSEPIRLLHFADVHIGVESYGRIDPQTGLSSRVRDFLRRMDEMVEYARRNEVDLAIFAGDAFKSQNPNPTFQREFAFRIRDLIEMCPVVLLARQASKSTKRSRCPTSPSGATTPRTPYTPAVGRCWWRPRPTRSARACCATR